MLIYVFFFHVAAVAMISQLIFGVAAIFLLRFLTRFIEWIAAYTRAYRLTRRILGPQSLPIIGCIHLMPRDSKGLRASGRARAKTSACERIENSRLHRPPRNFGMQTWRAAFSEILGRLVVEARRVIEAGESVSKLAII